ncbi:aldehyde dehydrogenase family protein [Methanopyrus sp.]
MPEREFGCLIGGEWVEGEEELLVLSPYDDSEVGRVLIPAEIDVDELRKHAKEGLKRWRERRTHELREALEEAARLVRKREKELARLIALEGGKPIREARFEVRRTAEVLRLCAGEAERLWGETLPGDAQPGRVSELILTVREPVGVVLSITPYNFPLMLPAHKLGPALAARCSVVHKPASETPLSSLRLAELLLDAGVDERAIQVVVGPGGELGERLARSDFDALSFTGSREVGERLLRISPIPRKTLELGGNDPVIVDETVEDLERVAEEVVRGACSHAGQVCIAVERAIVVEDAYEEFVEAAARAAESLRVGNPLDERTDVGPLLNDRALRKVMRHVEDAVERGAEVVTGGEPRERRLLPPTVLADVPEDALVAREETFGPVLPVLRVEDFDEALRAANATEYGLHAAVFTNRLDRAVRAARELEAGGVIVNGVTNYRVDYMPFGGVKASGVGREGVPWAVREFTEEKTIVLGRGSS